MALEIGQVVSGIAIFPTRRGQSQDGTAATQPETTLPGEQAPPLTGVVGGKALSGEALQTLQGTARGTELPGAVSAADESDDTNAEGELTDEEKEVVEKLKARDQEVRRHEAAHAAAGGQYAGAPTFSYQQGPDGKRYAIGGEVSIDTSPGSTPEETIRKADQIRAAALAPADPSGQDQAVAAAAIQMKAQAQAEKSAQRAEELKANDEERAEEEPAVPGAPKPEETGPEIARPKPVGQRDETAEAGAGPAANDRRNAAAAEAYGRTENSVRRTGDATTVALSLVA